MEKGYYKPDLSEFHIGFEYEEFVRSGSNTYGAWETTVFTQYTQLTPVGYCINTDVQSMLERGEIRVKYLDEQDFIECGWNQNIGKYIAPHFTLNGYTLIRILVEDINDYILGIYDINKENRFNLGNIIFKGTIKNKSELKQIMKMLNITE